MNPQILAQIIAKLNSREDVSSIFSDTDNSNVSVEEKQLIERYLPQKHLIIYGTLAPDKPNHHIMQPIIGEWKRITIYGKLEEKGWGAEQGFFGFAHDNGKSANQIDSWVLISDSLPENFPFLDDFEGEGYKRILCKYNISATDDIGVGYIYAINN